MAESIKEEEIEKLTQILDALNRLEYRISRLERCFNKIQNRWILEPKPIKKNYIQAINGMNRVSRKVENIRNLMKEIEGK